MSRSRLALLTTKNWSQSFPRRSSVELLIIGTIFLCSTFFTEIDFRFSNYTSRHFLTRAAVDHQMGRLDKHGDDLGVHGALYEGHLYSDKPPGSSTMTMPQYIILGGLFFAPYRAVRVDINTKNQDYVPEDVFAGWLGQLLSLALYSAIAFVVLKRIFDLTGIRRRRVPL